MKYFIGYAYSWNKSLTSLDNTQQQASVAGYMVAVSCDGFCGRRIVGVGNEKPEYEAED